MKNILLILILICSKSYCQNSFSSDKDNHLIFKDSIKLNIKNIKEIATCIVTNDFIESIKNTKNNTTEVLIYGEYEYSYYVNNSKKQAGIVKHNYKFTIKKEYFVYEYFNISHEKSDSEFNSLGVLPNKFNPQIEKTFTETQYNEILTDLKLNFLNQIRIISNRCFK